MSAAEEKSRSLFVNSSENTPIFVILILFRLAIETVPRIRTSADALDIKMNQQERGEARASRETPEPWAPKAVADVKMRLLDEKRFWVKAQLTPVPDDDVDATSKEITFGRRLCWFQCLLRRRRNRFS